MPAAKAVWAIDIGQCALKALHARLAGENIEIDTFVTIEHEQILSQPDADEPELIRATLSKFVSQHQVGKDPIVISVPGHRSFARFTKLPPVEPKKIPDIVHYEATQQIPFGIDEVIWDYQVFQSPDSPELEVGIFAIKRALIAQYLDYFQQLDLHPSLVQPAPIALYNACVFEGLVGEEASIIADVGAQNTNFLIAEGHRLWLRNIPIGGNNFTEALQKSFKLNFAKAEQLKCTAATSKYARAVFQSMRPVFSDLSAEFQRSIGAYTSVNRESQVQRLYALGNAFRLPGLLKFLQQNLGIAVNRVETFSKLKLAEGLNEPEFSENVLTFAPAYGLAIQGLDQARVTTDLMPAEIVREALWSTKQYWFAAAAGCLVLAAGAVWLRAVGDLSAISNDRDEHQPAIQAVVNKYNSYKTQYQKLKGGPLGESSLVEDVAKISAQRKVMPKLMQVLTSAIPKPPGELAQVRTGKEYKAVIEEMKRRNIQRKNRELVFITRIAPQYIPEITPEELERLQPSARRGRAAAVSKTAMGRGRMPPGGMMMDDEFGPFGPGFGAGGPGLAPGMVQPRAPAGRGRSTRTRRKTTGTARRAAVRRGTRAGRTVREEFTEEEVDRGFFFTIEGMTPLPKIAAANFLNRTLIQNLKKYDQEYARKNKETIPFWIDHVTIHQCKELIPPEELERMIRTPRSSGTAQESPEATSGQKEEVLGPKDPLTGEPMAGDTCFTITCVVHLGPPPEVEGDQELRKGTGSRDRRSNRRSTGRAGRTG